MSDSSSPRRTPTPARQGSGSILAITSIVTVVWVMVLGSTTTLSVIGGALVGLGIALIVARQQGQRVIRPVMATVRLLVTVIVELVVSSLQVAHDVVTPSHRSQPRVIAVPVRLRTTGAKVALANAVSLTPGTLSLDLDEERGVLFIHAMYAADPEAIRASIIGNLEDQLMIIEGSDDAKRSVA